MACAFSFALKGSENREGLAADRNLHIYKVRSIVLSYGIA